jgi:hypothetical protein
VSADQANGGATGGELTLQGQTKDIAIYRPPETILAEAHKAAVALQDVIKNKKDPVMMNGQQYLEYEDWQTVGRFYGITAKVESVEFVQYGSVRGFSASAVALRADGFELSRATGDCLSDEPKWSSKPKYEWRDKEGGGGREKVQVGEEPVPLFQLKSMAQTRACAKALRNVLAWVVVLAGYKATPAEELERERDQDSGGSQPRSAGSGRTEAAQGSSAPAAGSSGQPEGATKVKNVTTKDGSNDRGPWKKYSIYFEDGRQASTFSQTDGEHAERAKQSGAMVIPKIKKDGKFFNLEGFAPWPKKDEVRKEEHPNAAHDEPVDGPEKILTVREINTEAGKRWAIQTSKRVVLTDKAQHVEDANEARKENMGLTPRIEVVEGRNRLLAWEETIAMHAAEAQAGGGEAGGREPGDEPAEEKATEKAPRTRARKGSGK